MRELSKRLCLYGHTTGFHPKTQKLDLLRFRLTISARVKELILRLYLSDLLQGMFWKLTKGRLCFNEYGKQKESVKNSFIAQKIHT